MVDAGNMEGCSAKAWWGTCLWSSVYGKEREREREREREGHLMWERRIVVVYPHRAVFLSPFLLVRLLLHQSPPLTLFCALVCLVLCADSCSKCCGCFPYIAQ